MILQIIVSISLVYSVSAVVENVQVTLSNVTSGFNGDINDIIPYPGDPSMLVVADEYALWKFNPVTKEKSLIAGSSSRGYREGTGGEARFSDLYLAQFNQTTIIAADDNYCVRLINVETRSTERYAGVCQFKGDDDGDRLCSKMGFVWGIARVGNDFYIPDWTYKKIRRISGNTMSTVFTETLRLTGITSFGNKLIYSFGYGFGEFDLVTGLGKRLSGSEDPGFEDGTLNNARYFLLVHPVDWITENILLVAEAINQAVRIVDLNERKVTSISLSVDVISVRRYLGDIYIGLRGGIIKKFPFTEIAGICPGLVTALE